MSISGMQDYLRFNFSMGFISRIGICEGKHAVIKVLTQKLLEQVIASTATDPCIRIVSFARLSYTEHALPRLPFGRERMIECGQTARV